MKMMSTWSGLVSISPLVPRTVGVVSGVSRNIPEVGIDGSHDAKSSSTDLSRHFINYLMHIVSPVINPKVGRE
jgi:hypothetical protein